MSLYNTKEFKLLQSKWYAKLAEEGFDDIEDKNEMLKQPNRRTIAWKNRDVIRDFYDSVNDFLRNNKKLSKKHRNVLELWAKGIYLVKIAEQFSIPLITVKSIVRKYKRLILSGQT